MANYIIYDTLENALARADQQGQLMNYNYWVNGTGTRYHTYPVETNNNKYALNVSDYTLSSSEQLSIVTNFTPKDTVSNDNL